MSMILSNSGEIDCKTCSKSNGAGFFDNEIRIGEYYIDIHDFAEMVMYFFTNTDLDTEDVRVDLQKRIVNLHSIDGYNSGHVHLSED